MQIAAGSTQVIDDVYVLNGAIYLHTFNYPMMEHGMSVYSSNIEGVKWNGDWNGSKYDWNIEMYLASQLH